MVFWRRRGAGAALRLGVVASRKVGGAVQRARAKRRLRSAYRLNRHRFRGDCDVVLIARAAAGRRGRSAAAEPGWRGRTRGGGDAAGGRGAWPAQ